MWASIRDTLWPLILKRKYLVGSALLLIYAGVYFLNSGDGEPEPPRALIARAKWITQAVIDEDVPSFERLVHQDNPGDATQFYADVQTGFPEVFRNPSCGSTTIIKPSSNSPTVARRVWPSSSLQVTRSWPENSPATPPISTGGCCCIGSTMKSKAGCSTARNASRRSVWNAPAAGPDTRPTKKRSNKPTNNRVDIDGGVQHRLMRVANSCASAFWTDANRF